MGIKTLTIPQYARIINKSRQAVMSAITKEKKGRPKPHLLPNVISYKKIGRDYILEVAV